MARRFEGFVVLADMRTGSNLLQEKLNLYDGVRCDGELFNPSFVGSAGQYAAYGVSMADRERDPLDLIARARSEAPGIAGFRLFPDHDPRVQEHVLRDRKTAKIILTRNPLETYVSLKTAQETGQWWLGDVRLARTAHPAFDPIEFEGFLARRAEFQDRVRRVLQITGQTAFHVHYDDLGDEKILDGLVRFLGRKPKSNGGSVRAKVQNPVPLETRISNFADLETHLAALDLFEATRLPDFEPRRGANVGAYHIAHRAGLAYLPVPGVPSEAVLGWLQDVNGGDAAEQGNTRKALRQWKRSTPGHRSFTVVAHPAYRAYRAFCRHILVPGPDCFSMIRQHLLDIRSIDLPLPGTEPAVVAGAFEAFLEFVKANLAGQTGLRVPAVWASQSAIVRGMAEAVFPDAILRLETIGTDLGRWSGHDSPKAPGAGPEVEGFPDFAAIHTESLERAARAAYSRDYMMFGFGPWLPGGQAA